MRQFALFCLAVSLLSHSFLSSTHGQGRLEDYQRADGLWESSRGKVFRTKVHPHWLKDSNDFWYRVEIAPNEYEFVFVDSKRGVKRPAFNHGALARALSKATKEKVERTQLPFRTIHFNQKRSSIQFSVSGSGWKWDLRKKKLQKADATQVEESTVKVLQYPRRSSSSSTETSISFVNRTDKAARVYWVNPSGGQSPYGRIAPGKVRDQHTFAGHVWVVKDESDSPIAVFEATEDPGVAIIDHSASVRLADQVDDSRKDRNNKNSPDGKWLASIKDHNVLLKNLEDGEELSLSHDGSPDDPYIPRIHWSPDSTKLVVFQERPGQNRQIHMVESSPQDQLQPKLHTMLYVKPGDRLAHPRPRLFDVVRQKQVAIPEEALSNPFSISQVRWLPDSSEFAFLYNERGHQALMVYAVDATTGELRTVVEEKSETFVCYSRKSFGHYVDASREVIWMSERDGWNHLYLYDYEQGEVKNQITRGEWVVREVVKVDEEARQIWFRAGGVYPDQDPYYLHECRVNFDGSEFTILTDGDGSHQVEYSPDRQFILDSYSRVDMPTVTELRRTSDGSLVCRLEAGDCSRLLESGWNLPERFVAKGRDGKTDIYGIIHRPTNFEPGKKYPVIEKIYAGPHGAFVPKTFSTYHRAQAIAELGFIVVQIDGMGTSFRSKAFHDVCWQNLGDSGFPDRILWMKAAAEKHPEMDLERVGIYGGSAGGQSTLRGLLAHGDFYDVGVADCGCHDNRMDKIWWNEQWMGWPIGPHYKDQSNVTQAHKLVGKVLLIVGELDRNVDPASTMQVVDALIKADKDFDLLVVPGGGHGIGSRPYGLRRTRDFFVRHLLGVEPRGSY